MDALPLFEMEAKKRQAHGLTAPGKTLCLLIDKAIERSDQQAGQLTNGSRD